MKPKILVGMGTCDMFKYAEEHVISKILAQTYSDFDFLITDNSEFRHYEAELKLRYPQAIIKHLSRPKYFRDAVGQVRKYITDYAVANGYDYLFFVDADFIIELDTLEKLLRHKTDFVTAVIGYLHQPNNFTSLCLPSKDPSKVSKIPGLPPLTAIKFSELDNPPSFQEIVACGLSCCLIDCRLLIGINFYVSHEHQAFLEDFIFCRDIQRKGFKLFVDKTIRPFHLHRMMPERNFRASNSGL